MIVDLFAGPGGWDLGARALGLDPIGVELDRDACATRAAAGLRTIRADVASLPLGHLQDRGGVEGLIASPPCTAFSSAGKKQGRRYLNELVRAITRGDWACRPAPDPLVWLVLEVGRWVEALSPRWVACEQVPSALPAWEAYARWLAHRGYRVWTGRVSAEQYGAPQVRERGLLLASLDRAYVGPPTPTHQKYVAARADGGRSGFLLPWVSMEDAIPEWRDCTYGFARRNDLDDGGEYRARDFRSTSLPAFSLTEEARSFMLHTNRGQTADGNRQRRSVSAPAPAPAFTGKGGGQWELGDDTMDGKTMGQGRKLRVDEALILQTFPPDHPVQGSRTAQFRQIGDAVPPLLAEHALRSVCPQGGEKSADKS